MFAKTCPQICLPRHSSSSLRARQAKCYLWLFNGANCHLLANKKCILYLFSFFTFTTWQIMNELCIYFRQWYSTFAFIFQARSRNINPLECDLKMCQT